MDGRAGEGYPAFAMFTPDLILRLGEFLVDGSLAIMLFFAAVIAPTTFKRLPEEMAGKLIRSLFPVYYLLLTMTTGLATFLISAGGEPDLSIVVAFVTLFFFLARQVLMPRINDARDGMNAGDEAKGRTFDRLHRLSVIVNLGQMIALAIVVVMLGL